MSAERTCRVCGCTQLHACPGGCWWVEDDLCSECQTFDRIADEAGDDLFGDDLYFEGTRIRLVGEHGQVRPRRETRPRTRLRRRISAAIAAFLHPEWVL